MNNYLYWIWLSKLNIVNKFELLKKYKTPENIWNASNKDKDIVMLKRYFDYMQNNQIDIINIYDEQYPEKLKNIYDPPVVLYVKGNKKILNSKSIGVIGCRICSEYGKTVASHISYDLAKNDLCIISGLARGIDSHAHMGAIAAKEKTIAVVGTGLDIVYPTENEALYNKIIETGGAVISEYIVGTKPEKKNFPERNRIISGLSKGIVVVEAREKSGTFITVDFALEQGKNIYAVPGNITSFNSEGTNELIKQGAKIITSAKDIIEDL